MQRFDMHQTSVMQSLEQHQYCEYNLNTLIKPKQNAFSLCFAALQVRLMSEERTLHIAPSRFQWNKFKDQVHLYIMLGVIPITALILYVNIFIGPAQLTPIPEGYTPKHWEYHRVSVDELLDYFATITMLLFAVFCALPASNIPLAGQIHLPITAARL